MADKLNRRIRVSVKRTINLGDFNSASIEASLEVNIPDKADLEESYAELWDQVNGEVDKEVNTYDEEASSDSYEENEKTSPDDEFDPSEEFEDSTEDDSEEEFEEDSEEEDLEEEELTEDMINDMSQKELVELCETTEGLEDIDVTLKPKILRVMIVDALFEEEDSEEDSEDGFEEDEGEDSSEDSSEDEGGDDEEWADDDWDD